MSVSVYKVVVEPGCHFQLGVGMDPMYAMKPADHTVRIALIVEKSVLK